MRKLWVSFILLVLVVGVVSGGGFVGGGESNSNFKVMVKCVSNQNHLRILSMKTLNNNVNIITNKAKANHDINILTVNVTQSEYEELLNDPNVITEKIYNVVSLMIEDTNITGADLSWDLKIGNLNLTGNGQAVCILDTGVDYTHPDLGGCNTSEFLARNCLKIIGGWDFGDNDFDPLDHNGHGTHVAGIVAANGKIKGMAPDSKIVAIKVFADNGDSTSNSIVDGIDWCVNHSAEFNISVISMSLGFTDQFGNSYLNSTYCDSDFPNTYDAVQSAVDKNISVVAASGNDAANGYLGAPACLSNVISVGATYDENVSGTISYPSVCNDSNFFLDNITCFTNRNFLLKLLAPGAFINSTMPTYEVCLTNSSCINSTNTYSENYDEMVGTSMATPMVSGAIAIIKQMLKLTRQSETPSEIENILYNTGKQIYDSSSGLNFSRINVYDAILSLDNIAPNVTLVLPTNNKINITKNQTFICNATDWQLANVTFYLWNSSGGLVNSSTNNLSGTANVTSFSVTNMSFGNYEWNCFCVDAIGNSAYASVNFSLTIGGISTTLLSPEDNKYTNVNDTNFSCQIVSDSNYELANVTFYLWNSSWGLINSSTKNISGFSNMSIFNYSFVDEGNYSWNCLGINNASNESWGGSNYSIVFDVSAPVISELGESVSSSGATISWMTNESANSSVSINSGSWSNHSSYVMSHSIVISGLSSSTIYNYVATSCDRAWNCVNSSDSFTTSAVIIPISSSGGGGSSASISSTPKTYEIGINEIGAGYTQKLKKDDKINFSIFDFVGGRHLLSINDIGVDYVNLTIESEPINLKLGVGQSAKLNLTSPIYYDLFVKLDAIVGDEAELTIQLINEPIDIKIIKTIDKDVVETKVEVVGNYLWIVVVLVVVLAGIVFVVIRLNRKKLKGLKGKGKGKKKDGKKIKT